MPERLFKYETVEDLKTLRKSLVQSLVNGSTTALKNSNSGFLVQTGEITQADIRARIMAIRHEIYLRGCGDANNSIPPDVDCALLEPSNPYREKVMRTQVVRGASIGNSGFASPPYSY